MNGSYIEEIVQLENVRLWLNNGRISQIGLVENYSGTLEDQIGIGNTLSDLMNHFGELVEDEEDNLMLQHYPGICFETEMWEGELGFEQVSDNIDKKIAKIYVYPIDK